MHWIWAYKWAEQFNSFPWQGLVLLLSNNFSRAIAYFYASKHRIASVFNVAGRCCSTRLVYVCCLFLLAHVLSHDFIKRFSNDPMRSMNCKPTAQTAGTQQAMIDCRKGSVGNKRDISAYIIVLPSLSCCDRLNISSGEYTLKEHALQRRNTINIIRKRTAKPRSHAAMAIILILTTTMRLNPMILLVLLVQIFLDLIVAQTTLGSEHSMVNFVFSSC
ncbi:hypothetical protein DFS33DRAFT_906516 [Desarmillaria ectypa]|nr:hypothetical protein DFS33DRAFT_906516 [Desarmillaria ectypa]